MKKTAILAFVFLLQGCGPSMEEKVYLAKNTCKSIENSQITINEKIGIINSLRETLRIKKIFSPTVDEIKNSLKNDLCPEMVLGTENYENFLKRTNQIKKIYKNFFNTSYKKSDLSILVIQPEDFKSSKLINLRNELYIQMATSIFEKETSTEEKKKLLSILNEISNFSGIEIIPMRVSSNVKVLLGKKYLDVLSDIEDPKWGAEYLFDIETRMLIFQEYAKVKDLYYDLSKKEFISAELCRAVDKNKLQYTSALIDYSMGMIDIGKIRCIEHKGTMIEFLGNTEGIGSDSEVKSMLGVCPMSLRRVSGTNYASAVSARINSFRNNYEEVDPNKIKSYSDAVTKIKKSIAQGISKTPKLSPVPGNMNALLDEYDNTWMFGGDCSLESNARFH